MPPVRRRDRLLLAAAVVLQLVVLYAPRAPAGGERLGLDKVVHVGVFAVVAWAAVRCRLRWQVVLAVLVAHAAVSELLQAVALPHRDGDVWDAVADSLGAAAGTVLGLRTARGPREGALVTESLDLPQGMPPGRQVGRLLVAAPSLREPTFARTVVLLLDHGPEGALGVVLNRPMQVEVSVVLPAWQPHVTAPSVLFEGGPVALDSALGLVGVPGDAPEPAGVRRISGSLGLVDLDVEPAAVVGDLAGVRVFAGYAGWASGQLEREVEAGGWFVVDGEARDPFTDEPDDLWRRVLRRQPGELAFVSTYPPDPEHN